MIFTGFTLGALAAQGSPQEYLWALLVLTAGLVAAIVMIEVVVPLLENGE